MMASFPRLISLGITWRFILAVVFALLGSLQAGMHIGKIGLPRELIKGFYADIWMVRYEHHISEATVDLLWTMTDCALPLAACLGVLMAPLLANCCGRKNSLLLVNGLCLLGNILMALGMTLYSFEMIIVGRFILGWYTSLAITLVDLYIQELSPPALEDAFSVINQLTYTIGITIGQEVCMEASEIQPFIFYILIGLLVLHELSLLLCPNSPSFQFVICKNEEQAVRELQKLRGSADIWDEVDRISLQSDSMEETSPLRKLFSDYKLPLCIALIIQTSAQLAGRGELTEEAREVFLAHSFPYTRMITWIERILWLVFSTGGVLCVAILGRKYLLACGQIIMALCNLVMVLALLNLEKQPAWLYVMAANVCFAAIAYEAGPGTVSEDITGELFGTAISPWAMAITASWSWLWEFILALCFDRIKDIVGPYAFAALSIIQLLSAAYTCFGMKQPKRESPPPSVRIMRDPC